MMAMRITLTMDADLELFIRRQILRTNSRMKAVVNDALRACLGIRGKPARLTCFKVEPHGSGF